MGSSSGKVAATGAAGVGANVEAPLGAELASVPPSSEYRSATGGCANPLYLEIDSPGSSIGWYPAGGPNCCVLPDSWERKAGAGGTFSLKGRAKRGSRG